MQHNRFNLYYNLNIYDINYLLLCIINTLFNTSTICVFLYIFEI